MGFRTFKEIVRNLGGVWAGKSVYFSQTQSQYTAAYLPEYPAKSVEDRTIICGWLDGMWYYSSLHTENIRRY